MTINIFLLGTAFCLLASPAFAYVDPGTAGMVMQLLLGGIAGAIVLLKLYWSNVKNFFRPGKQGDPS